jgi:methyltransferase (TIGR00027 family)
MLRLYESLDWMMPRQFEGFGHRKIFVETQVEVALRAGVRQVVVLGAGFDTLCLRLAPRYPDVEFVEVDHPATGAAKAKGIAAIGGPPNMLQILVDLGERSLEETLFAEHRFAPETPSVFVAEGLLQYLSDDEVEGLLRTAAAVAPPGSRFVLTHAIPGTARWVLGLASLIGEPWRSAVSSGALPEYVRGSGWSVITPVDDDASHGLERYAVAERD